MQPTQPVAGIYLEWKKGTATFADGPRYVGVRVDTGDPSGEVLSQAIIPQIRRSQAESPKSTPWWPAYTVIEAPSQTNYWNDLSPYAESIVELIESAWIHFSPAVDIAVSTAQP